MNDFPINDGNILIIWIVTTALLLFYAVMVFRWGLRSGQFKDMDRSRYLALKSRRPR
jgi:cbb3-type cytochrome oxidase maturation protein